MEQGISQVELAETLGVDEMTVVNWEIKSRVPSIRAVKERFIQVAPAVERFFMEHGRCQVIQPYEGKAHKAS